MLTDRSGNVTFDELRRVCRTPILHRGLGLKRSELPEDRLRALWCALDENDSSTLKHDEFIRFLRLAPSSESSHAGFKHSKDYDAHAASMAIRAEAEALDKARVDYAPSTEEMRDRLQAAGIGLPGEEELMELSKTYNAGLERARKLKNKEGFSWISLFQELDDDGSGFISYDEVSTVQPVGVVQVGWEVGDKDGTRCVFTSKACAITVPSSSFHSSCRLA